MINDPSISVNKLGNYIDSRGARQRSILKDRKYPDGDFNIGMYHREAADAITSFLSEGAIDTGILEKQMGILNQMPSEKIGTARRINSNLDALERFSEMLDLIDFKGATPELAAHSAPKIVIHNVKISVRPEIILRGVGPKGQPCVGALKLHFSKRMPHTEGSAGYVSAILQTYCKEYLAEMELVSPPYCIVIDVASGIVFPGVKATAQRMKDIAAECQNIAALWPTI